MTLGAWALGLAVVAAAGAIVAREPWRARLARAHVALVLGSLAWLATDLILGTLRHRYAWAHTRTDYPFFYKLAGVWGGEEGTVLLWAAVVSLGVLALVGRATSGRAPPGRATPGRATLDALDARAMRLLLAFSGALSLFALLFGVFDATSSTQLAQAPFGRGLADVLVTPLMVIHPPVQFVGYGLMAVPAAYALAGLWEREGDASWAGRAFPWARRAWLFATLGLALGALWAYYVLSFGGYWAWDPVETSNLLPWLALTAFLHAGKQRMRAQGHETAAPVLAYGAMLLTLFATFATRSGLWISVHAFTDPTDRFEPDPGARLLAIADVHPPTRAFLGLLTAVALAGVAAYATRRVPAWGRWYGAVLLALAGAALLAPAEAWGAAMWLGSRVTPLAVGLGILVAGVLAAPFLAQYVRDDAASPRPRIDVRTLMATAVVLFAAALAVTFLLNLQVVNGPEREIFDARAPFVVLPIVAALTVMLALGPLGARGSVVLAAGSAAAAAGSYFVWGTLFSIAAPLCAGAALAAVLKLAHVQGRSAPLRMRVAGALLLVASLLALVMWSNPPTRLAGVDIPAPASLTLGFLGVGLAALGILGAVATFRARSLPLALIGGFSAAFAAGYGVGSLLAVAALVLMWRGPWQAGFWRHERVRVRETGIYLVHLAVALGLLGYAASTYAQEREVFTGIPLGASVEVADHTLTLLQPRATASDGKLDALVVPIALTGGGGSALSFTWSPNAVAYHGALDVQRTLAQDVYVSPMAFHTSEGWVGADSAAGDRVAPAGIDQVSFSVSVLPLMSLVWAAGWMMVLGMAFILAARDA